MEIESLFDSKLLQELLPEEQVKAFFEAFYFGEEPAYDLSLGFRGLRGNLLILELELKARPNQCLACNLTWGLPEVMERHPMLNLEGVVRRLEEKLPEGVNIISWELGATEQKSPDLHVIPLLIRLSR